MYGLNGGRVLKRMIQCIDFVVWHLHAYNEQGAADLCNPNIDSVDECEAYRWREF